MFGARIAMLRKSCGISQQALAKELGVSASAIGMYEQGRREPPCQIIVALARFFHVSTDFLLTGQIQRPGDAESWERVYEKLTQTLDGTLVLRSPAGSERTLDKTDIALFLAALLGY